MYNMWGFLLQSISVSIVAAIILLLKHLLADKLSPRWQYSVWILLCLRILVPVNLLNYIIPKITVWMEMTKSIFEKTMQSNYTAVYEPIQLQHVIPIIAQMPQSVTDWMFVIYVLGIMVFILRYLFSYIHLRRLLKAGLPVSSELEEKMRLVCEKYDLKPCKMIAVEGFSSAFICGVFRPVLVVPYAKNVDEKILLHELLHLKHHDTIQNIGWCLFRSLHWCNPLIHCVIHRIENDMESLCDQRVLERLEGEERRAYGAILLDMASQKYARIPGTSSISNGGKNISQRITAIVRFKKYPQGMALVSVCIILVLLWPTIIGNADTFTQTDYDAKTIVELEQAMAVARINRCGTVAGALDTYAKGLLLNNGVYIASASSLSKQAELMETMRNSTFEESGYYHYVDAGEYMDKIYRFKDYAVYNLDQRSENLYQATLALNICEVDSESMEYDVYILIPVEIRYEDAWVIEETGNRSYLTAEEYTENLPVICGKEYYGKNDAGEILFEIETKYTVDNAIENNTVESTFGWFTNATPFNLNPQPNARFDYYELDKHIIYTHFSDEQPHSYIELVVKEMDSETYFKTDKTSFSLGDEKGWVIFEGTTDWDGTIEDSAGGGYGSYEVEIIDIPSSYSVEMAMDGVEMEDFILEEVTD